MLSGRRFALLLGLTLLFRFWLGAVFPVTGDEAYFFWWGWKPDWGYYDHPPMVGWWLAGLLAINDSLLWLRLPAIVQPALLSVVLWWAWPRLWPEQTAQREARRSAVAMLVLLAPANVWNVLITTDTPLVYFSVLSALAWWRAAQERPGDGLRWYALSGVLLAGGVLSKFFVALLGFAFLVDVLRRRTRLALSGLVVAYACCVPALALIGWWNAANCWPNYLFNFVNRNQGAGASFTTPLLYAASLLYLLTPPALWWLARVWLTKLWRRPTAADFSPQSLSTLPTLSTLWAVPLLLFAILSIPKTIGLHWLLTFVPLALITLGILAPIERLAKLVRFFIGFALLHILALAIFVSVPLERWQKTSVYTSMVLAADGPGLNAALAGDRADSAKNWVLATDGYSSASTLGYHLRSEVIVFGGGSLHGRQSDITTDFRALDGRNMLIVRKTAPKAEEYAPWFRTTQVDSIELRGARFWRIRGEGFNYAAYRDVILRDIKDSYYRLPGWLPQSACPLGDRYFPDDFRADSASTTKVK